MSALGSPDSLLLSSSGGYEIARSLRFNDDDTAYLSRTPSSAGNAKTFTFSCWAKRSNFGTFTTLFSNYVSSNNFFKFAFRDDNRFEINTAEGSDSTQLITTAVYRDCSAWYHIVIAFDTTQATSTNRVRLYVNSVEVEDFDTGTYPPQNTETKVSATAEHHIGNQNNTSRYFDGYITEINFVDGTQLTASDFGETDEDTGAWIPKKYGGSYGTNGFYLSFSDNSGVTATTLGKDSSGNGNNWTPNNFSVTAGTGNDSLEDTPTNNWCALNPLNPTSATISNGNLDFFRAGKGGATSTFGVDSGKFYYEVTGDADVGSGGFAAGFVQEDYDTAGSPDIGQSATSFGCRFAVSSTTFKPLNGTTTTISGQTNDTTTVFAFAVNFDSGAVEVFRNGSSIHTQTLSLPAGKFFPAIASETSSANKNIQINFGQRGFAYTPPAGYKALNTANLPEPTIKDGTDYFNTVLYTGNATARDITVADSQGNSWQPDWVWIKQRNAATYTHKLFDSVRGVTKVLETSNNGAEGTDSGSLTAFKSDGFSLGSSVGQNNSGSTYVAWNWLAGGSTESLDTGSITSTVSRNVDAGFSIVSYTGNGTAGATIAHGLGVTPAMMIVKNRDATDEGMVYHKDLDASSPELYYVKLFVSTTASGEAARSSIGVPWNDTAPTSSVFYVKNEHITNASGEKYIAYCFAEVEGYSKFGSYTGNNSADGPFVYCGFRPAFVLVKASTQSYGWALRDSKRDGYNDETPTLSPHANTAEYSTSPYYEADFLSNGFKLRNTGSSTNASATYVFMAFAETPFKYANAR